MVHNSRCANAKTDAKYCKCSCKGELHSGRKKQDEKRLPINHLKIGDLVRIKPTTELNNRQDKVCFVEHLLGNRHAHGRQQEQVSLYGIDGEYVGDWFEDEFEVLGRKISVQELKELIETNKDKPGLVRDFERVLKEVQK